MQIFPRGLEFKALAERIESMAHKKKIVGELEIIWMSNALNRQIHVIAESSVMKYGEDYQARTPLTVRFTKLWEDV